MGTLGQSAYALMEKLDYVRVAGTDGEARAAGVLCDEIRAMGGEPRIEEFSIEESDIHTATLSVTQPFVKSYAVTGYGLSGSTPEGGLTAPFLYAEDGNDIHLAQARGKIILLNGRISPYLYGKLVKAGVTGFITVSGKPTDDREQTDLDIFMLRRDRHLKNGELGQIPGLCIRAVDAMEMLRRGEPAEVKMELRQTERQATSRNVIAEIPGTDKAEEWITVCAHFDSVPFSHGMYDNASGSAIIMEAFRYFTGHKPRRSLRFIWFGAEERGLLGSLHHIAANPEEVKATRLVINIDLAGQIIGGHQFAMTTHEKVGSFLRFLAQEEGFGVTIKQSIYSSDSTAYADRGVPALSFFRGGTTGHNRLDAIGLISAAALNKTACFMLRFTERIANSEVFPVPEGIPEALQEKLDIYFGRKPPEDEQ